MFAAVEGLLIFLCGSGEYDELTLAEMLSTLAKVVTTLCRQGNKAQRVTEAVGATDRVQYTAHHNQLQLHKGLVLSCPLFTMPSSARPCDFYISSMVPRYSQSAGCDPIAHHTS